MNIKLSVVSIICVGAISACSSSDDKTASDTENPARSFINNGYMLSTVEEYYADGSLGRSLKYEVDYEANTLTARDMLQAAQPVDSIITYDTSGDFSSITHYIADDAESLLGTEASKVVATRENGVLLSIQWNVLFGNESDRTITYQYNDKGLPSSSETLYLDPQEGEEDSEAMNYFYNDDDQLAYLTRTDVELPGVTETHLFSWSDDGTLSSESVSFEPSISYLSEVITYEYDTAGNISAMEHRNESGDITLREVFVYEPADEAVFNLMNLELYFH